MSGYQFHLIFSDQPHPPCGCASPHLFLWQASMLGPWRCFDCDPPELGTRVRVAQPGEHLDPPQHWQRQEIAERLISIAAQAD